MTLNFLVYVADQTWYLMLFLSSQKYNDKNWAKN